MRGLEAEERVFVAHLDVLGMSTLLRRSTSDAWRLLVDLADATESDELPLTDDSRGSLRERFFSDTILIRTQSDDIGSLHTVVARSLEIFRSAFRAGIPLRGGIAHGSWIESAQGEHDLFTGQALLSAHEVGEPQEMLSVALCGQSSARFRSKPFELANRTTATLEYNIPVKNGHRRGTVLNWPAFCRLELSTMSVDNGRSVAARFGTLGSYDSLDERARRKYDNTAAFIAASA